jgi:hypothetical protein
VLPTKNEKALDKETKLLYKSVSSKIMNGTCAVQGARSSATFAQNLCAVLLHQKRFVVCNGAVLVDFAHPCVGAPAKHGKSQCSAINSDVLRAAIAATWRVDRVARATSSAKFSSRNLDEEPLLGPSDSRHEACLGPRQRRCLYHRNAGKVVKWRDDLITATRNALACLRFAKPAGESSFGHKLEYPALRIVWSGMYHEPWAAEDETMLIAASLALASTVPQIRKTLHDTLVRSRRELTLPPASGRRFWHDSDAAQCPLSEARRIKWDGKEGGKFISRWAPPLSKHLP